MRNLLKALQYAERVAAQARKALTVETDGTDLKAHGRVKMEMKPTEVSFSSSEVSSEKRGGSSETVDKALKSAAPKSARSQRSANPMSRFVDVGGQDGTIVPSHPAGPAQHHDDSEDET